MKKRRINQVISCLIAAMMFFSQSIAVLADSMPITQAKTSDVIAADIGNTPVIAPTVAAAGTASQPATSDAGNVPPEPAASAGTGTEYQPMLGIAGDGNIGTDSFLNLFGSDKNQLAAMLRENGVDVGGDQPSVTDPEAFMKSDAARALNDVFNKTLNTNNVLAFNNESADDGADETGGLESAGDASDVDSEDITVFEEVYASAATEGSKLFAESVQALDTPVDEDYSKDFTPIALADEAFNADIIANGDMADYEGGFPTNRSWAQNTTNANITQLMDVFKDIKVVLAAEDFRGNENPYEPLPGSLPADGRITFSNPSSIGSSIDYFSCSPSAFARGYFGTNSYMGDRLTDAYSDPDVPLYYPVNVGTAYDFQLKDYDSNNAIHKTNEAFTAEFNDKTKSYSSIAVLYPDMYQFLYEGTYYVNFDDGTRFDVYTNNNYNSRSSNVGFRSYNIGLGATVFTESTILNNTPRRFDEPHQTTETYGRVGMSVMVIHLPAEYHNKKVVSLSGNFIGEILAVSGVEVNSLAQASEDPALSFSDVKDSTAALNWNGLRYYTETLANNKFTDYEIDISSDSGFSSHLPGYPLKISATGESLKVFPYKRNLYGLIPNTTYYARIRTTNGWLNSDWYQTAMLTTDGTKTVTYLMTVSAEDEGFTFDGNADPDAVVDSGAYGYEDSITLTEASPTWFGEDPLGGRHVFDYWDIGGSKYYPGDTIPVKGVLALMDENGSLNVTAKYKLELSGYGEGDGSSEDPYIIDAPERLITLIENSQISDCEGVYFKQTEDIDLKGYGDKIYPIGGITDDMIFKGHYNGQNKKIINFSYHYNLGGDAVTDPVYIGLFGHSQGDVENIRLVGAELMAENCEDLRLGAVAGYVSSGSFNNNWLDYTSSIYVSDCKGYVGGVAGELKVSVSRLVNAGSIYAKSPDSEDPILFAGGLMGRAGSGIWVENSYNQGPLTSDNNAVIGGVIGKRDNTGWMGVNPNFVYTVGRLSLINFDEESRNMNDYTTLSGLESGASRTRFLYAKDVRTVNGEAVNLWDSEVGFLFADLFWYSTYYNNWHSIFYDLGCVIQIPGTSYIYNGTNRFLPLLEGDRVIFQGDSLEYTAAAVTAFTVAAGDRVSTLAVGESKTIGLVTQPAGILATSFAWSSGNPGVCTVSSTGVVTAVTPGLAEITIYSKTDPTLTTTVQVTVTGTNASGIKCAVDGDENTELIELETGDTCSELTANVYPSEASLKKVEWTSANPAVATVAVDEGTGAVTVTGVGRGKTYITVTTQDGGYQDRVLVSVAGISVSDIQISPDSLAFDMGSDGASPASSLLSKSLTLSDDSHPEGKVNWESSDMSVAVVSTDGSVYPTGNGTAVVTAKSTDGSGVTSNECTVTVNAVRVDSIEAGTEEISVPKSSIIQLKVDIQPDNALNKRLAWTSSDPSVAYVDENGYVTTVNKGTTTITAVSDDNPDLQASTEVTVVSPVLGVRMLNRSKLTKLAAGKEIEIGKIEVYPSDADDATYTLTSSDPTVASIEDGKLVGHKAGQTRITAVSNGDPGKLDSVVMNVLEDRKINILVKDLDTNSPISGAVVDIFGETFTTDMDGKTVAAIPPDEPESIIKINKEGYKQKRVMEGFMYSGSYMIYLKPEDNAPYFEFIGYTEDYESFDSIEEITKATDKDTRVKIWTAIDWKGLTRSDVFIERGPAKIRMTPMSDNRYQIGYNYYYDLMNKQDGDYTIRATAADGTAIILPMKWGYLDYDEQVANLKLDQGDSDFQKTSNGGGTDSNMYNTGFDMNLPDGLPISLSINGSKMYMSIQFSASWSKAPGAEKFEKDPGAMDYAKAIKESITSGKMSQKLKDLTKAPPTNKAEKRIQVAVEIMGYMEGDLVKTSALVDLNALAETETLKFFGIDDEKYAALKTVFPTGLIPITTVSLEVANAGIKVAVDGKFIWSQQFMAGPIPVYVESSIGARIDQLLAFTFKNSQNQFRGKTGVTPYFNVYGAVGIGGVVSIGPSLDGRLPIQVSYPKPRHFTIDLNISLGIKLVFLFFDKTYPIFDGNWNLVDLQDDGAESYDQVGEGPSKSALRAASFASRRPSTPTGEAIMEGFAPMDRGYQSEAKNKNQNDGYYDTWIAGEGGTEYYNDLYMTSGYPNMMPRIARLYKGTTAYEIVVWSDDDTDRNSLNRSKLNFSIRRDDTYTPGNNTSVRFQAAGAVDNDATADGNFDIVPYISGNTAKNTAYVAYEDLSEALSYNDSDASDPDNDDFKDFVRAMRISVAKLEWSDTLNQSAFGTPIDLSELATEEEINDPSVTTIAELDAIANGSITDYMPKIATNGTDVAVTWIRNANADITGFTGRTSVKRAVIDSSGQVQVDEAYGGTSTPVLYQTVGYVPDSSTPIVVYMRDEDNDYSTMEDRSIYVKEGSKEAVKVATGTGIIDNPQLATVGGKLMLLWYNSNGNIYYIPDVSKRDALEDEASVKAVFASDPEKQYDDGGTKQFPATSTFRVINNVSSTGEITENALTYEAGKGVVTGQDPDGLPIVKQVKELYLVPYDKETGTFNGYTVNLFDESCNVGSMDAYIGGNGQAGSDWINTVFSNLTDMDADTVDKAVYEHNMAASLSVARFTQKPDLSLRYSQLLYNPNNVNSDATSAYVCVLGQNTGRAAIQGVKLELLDTFDNLLGSESFPDAVLLPGGEEQEFGMDYTWQKPLTEHTVTAKLLPLDDGISELRTDNNSAEAVFGGVDLGFDPVTVSTVGKYAVITGSVHNNSEKTASEVTAKLYKMGSDGYKSGAELKSVSLADLEPYKDTGFSFDMDMTSVNFNDDEDDEYDLQRNKYILEVTAGNSTDVTTFDNTESFTMSNPYAQVLPFTVSANDLVTSEETAVLKLAVTNNLPEDNSGTLGIRIVNKEGEQLAEAEKEISAGANETVPAEVTLEDFGSLTEPYMVLAGFKSAAKGVPLNDGETAYYSNETYGKVSDFKLSDNNKIESMTFSDGTLTKTSAGTIDKYELEFSGSSEISTIMNVAAADAFGALIAYQVDDGETKYLVSGEDSEAISAVDGTIINVTVRAVNGDEKIYRVKAVYVSASGGGSADSGESGGVTPGGQAPAAPTQTGYVIYVNGKAESAGTAVTTTNTSGQTVTTITVDSQKLEQKLNQESSNSVITIQVVSGSDVVVGELNGQMVKNMENKEAVLEIKTGDATYTLPAQQINIDAISQQLGTQVALQDIKVQVEIAKAPAQEVKLVEDSAQSGKFIIVAPPVEFNIKCTYGGKDIEVSSFNAYVERTIAIPDGADPGKITTGIVVDPDGTVRHVPTRITLINGRYFAVINSLSNSIYSVVWHPKQFKDVEKHWAKEAVNEMGSRMVISGADNGMFEPDRDITRAEFAAIIVRALGLKPGMGSNPFKDVDNSQWYAGYVKTAAVYNLITGDTNGNFGPDDRITREQAMTMIARAMSITKLNAGLQSDETARILAKYTDGGNVSGYAQSSIAQCIITGVISGRTDAVIAPKNYITRAEVAVIVERLLKKSELID